MQFLRKWAPSRAVQQPLVWGAVLTIVYYAIMQHPALHASLLHKYTTEHLTEYIIVALLFWVASDLTLRRLTFGKERRALQYDWLPERNGLEPPENARELVAWLDDAPAWLQATKVAGRLRTALVYVEQRGSAEGLRDYLNDMAFRDSDETHANYAFARFVVGVTPLLGLLGTVVHFGAALGGLTTDRMLEQLGSMVSGMGTAFNTTCVALSVCMSTLFFLFLTQRAEERIDHETTVRVESDLLNRFAVADERLTPFLDAVRLAQQATLSAMQQSHRQNLELWTAVLEQAQSRWETADRQREGQCVRLLEAVEQRQTGHAAAVGQTVDRVAELNRSTARLAEMLVGEGRLADLQNRLSDNIELLHRTQQFDQAMHSLTAAIHLLTAHRAHPSGSMKAA